MAQNLKKRTISDFFKKTNLQVPVPIVVQVLVPENNNGQQESDLDLAEIGEPPAKKNRKLDKDNISDSDPDSLDVPDSSKKKKRDITRRYQNEFLKFGFILQPGSNSIPKPQCILCGDVLSNEAMKKSKLLRHLKTNHSELSEKPLEFFEQQKAGNNAQKNVFKNTFTLEKSLLKSSYIVALQIARCKKPYSIGEELIKPCLTEVTAAVLGKSASDKMKSISLSNSTIERRISDLSDDVEDQLLDKIKTSEFFALQLDESCDVSSKEILVCFVRYTDFKGEDMGEEFLCSIELPSYTTGSEIFQGIDKYLKKSQLEWKNCIGLCTDGAGNMTGRHSGVVKRIKDVAHPELKSTHCIIHREHLAAKKMSVELNKVLTQSVSAVNAIKTSALNTRLFTILCEEMGSGHSHLLLHAEVRWLSRGKVLKRLFELREETKIFLTEKKSLLGNLFDDTEWLAKLAYLADIFSLVNELNLSLQGKMTTIFNLSNKMEAFIGKIDL